MAGFAQMVIFFSLNFKDWSLFLGHMHQEWSSKNMTQWIFLFFIFLKQCCFFWYQIFTEKTLGMYPSEAENQYIQCNKWRLCEGSLNVSSMITAQNKMNGTVFL